MSHRIFYKIFFFVCLIFLGTTGARASNYEEVPGLPIKLYSPQYFQETPLSELGDILENEMQKRFQVQVKENILPALRIVESDNIFGTGFYIDKRFITNAHILSSINPHMIDENTQIKSPVLKRPVSVNSPDFAEFLPSLKESLNNRFLNFLEQDQDIIHPINPFYFYIDLDTEKESYTIHHVLPLNMIPDYLEINSPDNITRHPVDEPIIYKIADGLARPGISGSPVIKAQPPYEPDHPWSFSVQSIIYGKHQEASDILATIHAPTAIHESYQVRVAQLIQERHELFEKGYNDDDFLQRLKAFQQGVTIYPFKGVNWVDLLGLNWKKKPIKHSDNIVNFKSSNFVKIGLKGKEAINEDDLQSDFEQLKIIIRNDSEEDENGEKFIKIIKDENSYCTHQYLRIDVRNSGDLDFFDLQLQDNTEDSIYSNVFAAVKIPKNTDIKLETFLSALDQSLRV
jgi:hypothetical protein